MNLPPNEDYHFQSDDRWTENTAEALVTLLRLGEADSDEICETLNISVEQMHYLMDFLTEVYGFSLEISMDAPVHPGFDFRTPM